jgi:hypothetical protein
MLFRQKLSDRFHHFLYVDLYMQLLTLKLTWAYELPNFGLILAARCHNIITACGDNSTSTVQRFILNRSNNPMLMVDNDAKMLPSS